MISVVNIFIVVGTNEPAPPKNRYDDHFAIPERTQAKEHQDEIQRPPVVEYRYSYLVNDGTKEFQMDTDGICINRSLYALNLLIPFGLDPDNHKDTDEYVLVLGSGGLIGSSLVERLKEKGEKVLYIVSRHHKDLRINGSLNIFDNIRIKFCYFLAYEVGGAKYLQQPSIQNHILDSNMKLSRNIFGWLKDRQIRYAFASSSLSADNSTYGFVKRYGENFTYKNPNIGRMFRLWNAYGFEYPGPKSHAIPDFIFQCLTRKEIRLLTTGTEKRQFSHVVDISDALIAIMDHFIETPIDFDISDGIWVTMNYTAHLVTEANPGCEIVYPEKTPLPQRRHEANISTAFHKNFWQAKIEFLDGIKEVTKKMGEYIQRSINGVCISIIIDCGDEFDDSTIPDVTYIINSVDQDKEVLTPIRIEIIAAAKKLTTLDDLPCTVLTFDGNYLQKAVDIAQSNNIIIMNHHTLPTIQHLSFFQHELARDLIFYYAGYTFVDDKAEAKGETNATFSYFDIIDDCDEHDIAPSNLSFIAATKATWDSIGVPPPNVNIEDWFLRFVSGYHTVKFEFPVWSWDNTENPPPPKGKTCCSASIKADQQIDGEPTIKEGQRKLVK